MSTLSQAVARLERPQRVRLRSGTFAYRRAGSGPPLLLVHGWGGSSRHWVMTLAHFAEFRTIYAMDLPGHGESPPLVEMSSAERLAACIIEFADHFQLDQFDVNGHSFGAGVAVYLGARYPQRVRRLIISSFGIPATALERLTLDLTYYPMHATLKVWRPWLGWWQPWQTCWQLWMLGASAVPIVPWMVSRPFFYEVVPDIGTIQEGYSEFMLMDQRTSLENTISLGNPQLREALGRVAAPTLLVAGRQDLIVPPATVETAARMLANGRVNWIDNCGHIPMIEQPAAYHQAVDSFLSEEDSIRAAAA